jgi:hypothetical protein
MLALERKLTQLVFPCRIGRKRSGRCAEKSNKGKHRGSAGATAEYARVSLVGADVAAKWAVQSYTGGVGPGSETVSLEIAAVKFCGELDAFDNTAQDQRLAEVTVVDQVGRNLAIDVHAEIEVGAVLVAGLLQPNGIF